MSIPANDYLTVDEAATLLRVSVSTIRRWIRDGRLRAHRVGRRLLLRHDDLAASVRSVAPSHGALGLTRAAPDRQGPSDPRPASSARPCHDESDLDATPPELAAKYAAILDISEEERRRIRRSLSIPYDPTDFDLGPIADLIDRSPGRFAIPPMTRADQIRALEAMERAQKFSDELLARNGGKPFPPSWKIINEARDERTRQLLGEDEPTDEPIR